MDKKKPIKIHLDFPYIRYLGQMISIDHTLKEIPQKYHVQIKVIPKENNTFDIYWQQKGKKTKVIYKTFEIVEDKNKIWQPSFISKKEMKSMRRQKWVSLYMQLWIIHGFCIEHKSKYRPKLNMG